MPAALCAVGGMREAVLRRPAHRKLILHKPPELSTVAVWPAKVEVAPTQRTALTAKAPQPAKLPAKSEVTQT